ncbi:MAG: quinol:electron acceptor oxidoreductase subunit ActD, partial [Bacteroidota bacterium]
TVLCAAHGMALTFFLRSKLLPGVEPHVIDDRMADDRFVMCIEVKDDAGKAAAHAAMKEAGAIYVKD